MKAIVYTKYGMPEVLHLAEVEKPVPLSGEVLIAVRAASVNYSDWALVRGKPWPIRFMAGGVLRPKHHILGADVAGKVEAVGEGVTQFQPGDEIFGDLSGCGWKGFAEFVSVPESALCLKPKSLTFEEAAAVPQAAVVALQGLRDKGKIESAKKVLINGASGGIGTFAVQLARYFNAEVTAVCSAGNTEMVRALGADHVIDYNKEDFTKSGRRFDLIIDIAASRSISDIEPALNPGGIYVLAGGAIKRIMQVSMAGKENFVNLSAQLDQSDLNFLSDLIDNGIIIPVIDRCYPLGELAEAVRYYGKGHSKGKVVIKVDHGQGE